MQLGSCLLGLAVVLLSHDKLSVTLSCGRSSLVICQIWGAFVLRQVAAENFFLGYRKVDLQPHEVLARVFIPFTRQNEFVREFKQAHRRDDDIAIVNAGMRVLLAPSHAGASRMWSVALKKHNRPQRILLSRQYF